MVFEAQYFVDGEKAQQSELTALTAERSDGRVVYEAKGVEGDRRRLTASERTKE